MNTEKYIVIVFNSVLKLNPKKYTNKDNMYKI